MKHRFWIMITIFFLVIGGCTVISANQYMKSLPLVTLINTVPNSIRVENIVTGNLYYQETIKMDVPEGCRIQEIFVQDGDIVTSGSPLLMIEETDLHIIYLQKKLESENLKGLEERGGTEGELAFWKRQIVVEELQRVENLLAAGGILYATCDGSIMQQGYKEGDITGKETRMVIGVAEGGCYLKWELSSNGYREYTSGYVNVQQEKKKLSWEKPIYKDGTYIFEMPLPELREFVHGQPVEIQLIYVSEEHEATLPKNCIRYYEDGSPYVYQVMTRNRNYGKESYVCRVGVTIEDIDDLNVVVKAELSNVVQRSTKELSDMEAVAIVEQ